MSIWSTKESTLTGLVFARISEGSILLFGTSAFFGNMLTDLFCSNFNWASSFRVASSFPPLESCKKGRINCIYVEHIFKCLKYCAFYLFQFCLHFLGFPFLFVGFTIHHFEDCIVARLSKLVLIFLSHFSNIWNVKVARTFFNAINLPTSTKLLMLIITIYWIFRTKCNHYWLLSLYIVF